MNRVIQIVHDEDGRVEKISIDEIISSLNRENDVIIVTWDDIYNPAVSFVYPGLIDLDTTGKSYILSFKRYTGTNKPRLYANCKLVERGVDYIVVKREDGLLFKITHALPAEILLNIINNPGIALWDLMSIEITISAKEIPDLTEEEATRLIMLTVEAVGYYVYILEIVRMEF